METGDVINLVTRLVLEQMNSAAAPVKTALVIGCRDCAATALDKLQDYSLEFYNETDFSKKLNSYDKIIVPYLSATSMARLASGIGGTTEEAAILECVMQNKEVTVCKCQLEDIEETCNPGYLALLKQYRQTLNSFGIHCGEACTCCAEPQGDVKASAPTGAVLSLTHKKIVTESDLASLQAGGTLVVSKAKKTIITPLAKDYIRTKKLIVSEE